MPAPALDLALDHYSDRQSLVTAIGEVAGQMWSDVNPARIADSWVQQIPELTVVTAGAQMGAARQADDYTTEMLDEQDIDSDAVARVDPSGFAGQASDARGLASLLANPVIVTLLSIQDGMDVARALGVGRANLDMLVRTQVADAGRLADQASLTTRPACTGYTRLAVGGSCSRCLLLSGKHYSYSQGFKRHPRCDCIHVPANDTRGVRIKSPEARYAEMSRAERTRAGFTKADQAALAEGADLGQVVNARRGMYDAGAYTRTGTTKRGLFGSVPENRGRKRLSVDQIYRDAVDRDDAIRLLQQNRYLLTPARVPVARPAMVLADSAEAQARRAARRARQAEIDRRSQIADLLAELDSLIGKKAAPAVYRQRLDLAATSGVSPDLVAKLTKAVESGNTTTLRGAITRTGNAEGITAIGRAGQKVKYSRRDHDPVGELPEEDEQVLIVRRGAKLTLGEETFYLNKAEVITIATPARKAAKKAAPTKAAAPRKAPAKKATGAAATSLDQLTVLKLRELAKAHGIPVPSKLKKADIIAHLRTWESGNRVSLLGGDAPTVVKAAPVKAVPLKPARTVMQPPAPTSAGQRITSGKHAGGLAYDAPLVEAAQAHVRRLVASDVVVERARKGVAEVLSEQATLTPHTMTKLRQVVAPDLGREDGQAFLDHHGRGTNAYYTFYGRAPEGHDEQSIVLNPFWHSHGYDHTIRDAKRNAISVNWSTPTGHTHNLMGATLSHEYGHHVSRMFLDGSGGMVEDVGQRLMSVMTRVLKTVNDVDAGGAGGVPSNIAVPFGGRIAGYRIDKWVDANKAQLSLMVSRYGSSSWLELLAEIWQEWSSLGEAARPHIREIGIVMQEIAEEKAVKFIVI